MLSPACRSIAWLLLSGLCPVLPVQEAATGILEGKIVMEPDGTAPGSVVEVTYFPDVDGRGRQTRSATDGTFRLDKLPVPVKGSLRLVSKAARIDASPSVEAGKDGKPVVIRVKASTSLVVNVRRSPGKPWIEPDLTVEWARPNSTFSNSRRGEFPRSGRFEMLLDDPTEPITVRFRAFGLPVVETTAVKKGPGDYEAELKTPPAGTITCLVRDAAEKPVPGAEVMVTFALGPVQSMPWREVLLRDWFTDEAGTSHLLHYDYARAGENDLYEIATASWTTGADGVARIEAVPAGASCEIAIAPPGFGPATSTYIALANRGEDEKLDFALEPAKGGLSLRILKADGAPAEGWRAIFQWGPLAHHGPRSFPCATVDKEGRLRAPFLEDGSTYDVILVAPDRAKAVLKGITVKDGKEILLPGPKAPAPAGK